MTDFRFEDENAIQFTAVGQESPVYGYSPKPGENGNWYIYDNFGGWQDSGIKVGVDIDVEDIEGGHRVTAISSEGVKTFDVMDGQSVSGAVTSVNGETGDVTIDIPDISGLQDKLIPGDNITIDDNNVISASGGGGVDPEVLKEYAKQEWVKAQGYLTEHQDLAEYAKKADVPNVPNWAKEPSKPSYTAQEVGALPDDTPIPPAYDDTQIKEDLSWLSGRVSTVETELVGVSSLAESISEVVG